MIKYNQHDDMFLDYSKKIFISSSNKMVFYLSILLSLIFVFTSITVIKTFYLRSRVNEYENMILEIGFKDSTDIVVENEDVDSVILSKMSAADKLVNCIGSSIKTDEIPDNILAIINNIKNYYDQSNDYFAFKYVDLYTGFSVQYNENQQIFAASAIKAPKDIYLYEMASVGKIDLNEKLTYTSGYYNTGSGLLKNTQFNKQYSVKTLIEYSTVHSDNAAHNMLMDKFGRENMLAFWKNKGTDAIFTQNNNWGVINAHDASIYMKELYRFYLENSEYGETLMSNFIKAHPSFIVGKDKYVVANKSGWSGSAIHDVAIVFAKNPYIVIGLSNLGNTDYYMNYFNKINDLAYQLHIEYWKYKMSICNSTSQY